MKKHLLMVAVAILSASFLTSCNKGLKDDVKELEKKLAEEQAKNAKIRQNLGADACIFASLSTNDGTEDISLSGDYCLNYSTPGDYTYIEDYGDSTYYIYVYKMSDIDDDNSSYIEFYYNHKTGETELDEAGVQVAPISGTYNYLSTYFYDNEDITSTITVNSFNMNTGAISFTYRGVSTGDYYDNYYEGQPMTMNISFSGSLPIYRSEEMLK